MRAVCTGIQTLPPRHYHTSFLYTSNKLAQGAATDSSRVPNGLICLLNYLTLIYLIHTLEHSLLFRHIYTLQSCVCRAESAGPTGPRVLNNLQGEKYIVRCVKSEC